MRLCDHGGGGQAVAIGRVQRVDSEGQAGQFHGPIVSKTRAGPEGRPNRLIVYKHACKAGARLGHLPYSRSICRTVWHHWRQSAEEKSVLRPAGRGPVPPKRKAR
ncbi:hypothetical protein GCM10011320_48540 [Neoroseomonas lacus]|uniref:Uncharacterized protein n=1 Tax=Neoroseomonas lacus TaxID=287609 RepID=A0A917NWB6_9PROT|nr:hypothetical protein GCM10011320_48540 [Neoroseomonas lacus]